MKPTIILFLVIMGCRDKVETVHKGPGNNFGISFTDHKVVPDSPNYTFHFSAHPEVHYKCWEDSSIDPFVYNILIYDQSHDKEWFGCFREDSVLLYSEGHAKWVVAWAPLRPHPSPDQYYFLNGSDTAIYLQNIIEQK